jgi:hypothetical protein
VTDSTSRIPIRVRAAAPHLQRINTPVPPKPMTFGDLWLHFERQELFSPAFHRAPTTIDMYYVNMGAHLLLAWGA